MQIELREIAFSTEEGPLIEEVSCTVRPGECLLVMGPSGSGKTLLMKIMAAIIPPSSGAVLFDGVETATMSDRELDRNRLRQGFVFQDAALWQNLSVLNNLTLATQYHFPKRNPEDTQRRVNQLCRTLGFTEDLSRRPARLSAGERKTAAIIRSMMLNPEIYFMDEPSGGLDASTADHLLALLKDLKSQGRSLVIATHDSEIASQLADSILVLDEGRSLAYDTVEHLTRTTDTRVREILTDVFDLSSTYDADILDILGGNDDPFA
ncbi:MAG: ATP-binding cassette domain-containing protein [Alkalispirochaeta sp.]